MLTFEKGKAYSNALALQWHFLTVLGHNVSARKATELDSGFASC